ncbi:MAG: UPF0175 family protein [Bacteroidales bacterium]|nr:UPF0175 family protein [Bacteroidales bacterium]MCF8458081.1 UPF0175 family protein [Bacteroidales bacterium]
MQTVTISVDIPSDILIALNESEKELKSYFQLSIALMLFQDGKLTLGKAIQLSGLSRHEFEKSLVKNKIPVSDLSFDQIMSDADKLMDI